MTVVWPDLGGALVFAGAVLLIIAAVAGFVVWNARRHGEPHILLGVTSAVARMWLLLAIVAAGVSTWQWLSGGDVWIPDLPVALPPGSPLPCDATGPFHSATLVCANVSSADATIAGLSLGTRLVLALGGLLGLVVVALPAVVIVVLCRHAMKDEPFARSAARWFFIAAIVLLVAGIGAEIATDAGGALAAAEVLPPVGEGELTTTGTFRLFVPLWPIGGALGLAALGVVFRHGWRLQRDTEGLV